MPQEDDDLDLDSLAGKVRGQVWRPGDPGFTESCEIWNARFTSRPDVVVRAMGPSDVSAAIVAARDAGLALTVKSGGHDYAGHSAARGGLLLDLASLNDVTVEPEARRVRVGPGARWGQVDAATQAHGLATTGSSVSTVGVAGFTLGGGEGWLTRTHGMALDNLLGAQVVTADGQVREANPEENSDLFWAIRGGSGNFGVVTRFDLALHAVGPELIAGQVLYPFERAPELMRVFRETMRGAPDELNCYAFILRIPPLDVFPEAYHGRLALDFVVAYAGDLAAGEAAVRPFRELGAPILDAIGPCAYVDLQQSFDAGMPAGGRWYSRSCYFDELSDDAIDAVVDHVGALPGDFTTVYFGFGGGAAGRVSPADTAFPHRGAESSVHIFPGWTDPGLDEDIMAWARALFDRVSPHGDGVYVNLLAEDEPERTAAAYGSNHHRLASLKASWDPDNLFRRNHNIR